MKQKKNSYYYNRIISLLLSNEVITIEKIVNEVGLSEKTIRTKVDQIDCILQENKLGKIEKRPRVGIWLNADETQRRKITASLDTELKFDYGIQERGDKAICCLLKLSPGEIITTTKLAEQLYLSVPTTAGVLKDCRKWFDKRGIEICVIRNKGITLECSEYSFRMAIRDFILQKGTENLESLLKEFTPGVDVVRIRQVIIKAENAWRLEFAEQSFRTIWILVCLSIARRNKTFDWGAEIKDEEVLQGYSEYAFAEYVYHRIEEIYQVEFSRLEIEVLALHILRAKLLEGRISEESNNYIVEYDKHIQEFVKDIIETVSNILNVDLSGDQVLQDSLIQHMRPAIFRLRYGSDQSEELTRYVKKEYSQVYRASWATSHLFEEYYDFQVTEDELVYLTLYFQAALERREHYLKAILITQTGMGHSQLLCEKIKKSVPEIEEIKLVSTHEFRRSQEKDVDLILNTTDMGLDFSKVVNIDIRDMGDEGIQPIRDRVQLILKEKRRGDFQFDSICHPLFEPELIFIHPRVESKDGLLEYMTDKMEHKGWVTPNFITSVLEREKATPTSIGSGVAIPHGSMAFVNESKVAIAVLEEPILWHGEMVDIVFLLAVKLTTPVENKKIQQFYKQFIFMDEKVDIIRGVETGVELYKYLIR